MEPAKEEITRRFSRLGSHELARIVGVDSRSHKPEVLEVAIEELRQRELSNSSFERPTGDVESSGVHDSNNPRTRDEIPMKDKRTVPLLMGAATSVSGFLIIASMLPEYIKSLDALANAPAFDSRLIVGAGFVLFGFLLVGLNIRR